MLFEIKAYRPDEGVIALSLEAANVDEARVQASRQGLDVVSIRQRWQWQRLQRKRRPFDLVMFSQELRALLDAGLSLIEALGTLARKEPMGDKRQLIETLIRQLREGKPFSVSLREFPTVFPPLYLALTSASEQTGGLAGALGRFIDYRVQMDAVKKRVVSSMIYPILLVGVGGLVILFLMTYVVPRFSRIYEDFGRDLPLMSKLLLQWGGFVQAHGWTMLIAVLLGAGFGIPYLKRRFGWRGLVRKLLAHPALGERFHAYSLARFYRTLGMLQQGGIPIVTALGLARELLGEEQQPALDRVIAEVRGGVALSAAMERAGLAPPVASDLLKVGEKAGEIGEKMIRVADFYDEDISRWTEWFVRLFEPLLMLFIGLFIALVVVLLYLPIFELAGSLQ